MASRDETDSLENILLALDFTLRSYQAFPNSGDGSNLEKQCIALHERFAKWEAARVPEFRPTTVSHQDATIQKSKVAVGRWPVTVDSYFDLYVAGVWNIARAAWLMLICMMIKLKDASGERDESLDLTMVGTRLLNDMAASIPYHLTENVHEFLSDQDTSEEIQEPGRCLGGLLLMHPLYVASRVPFISPEMRTYFEDCLAWIGSEMGIGQASLLAKVR